MPLTCYFNLKIFWSFTQRKKEKVAFSALLMINFILKNHAIAIVLKLTVVTNMNWQIFFFPFKKNTCTSSIWSVLIKDAQILVFNIRLKKLFIMRDNIHNDLSSTLKKSTRYWNMYIVFSSVTLSPLSTLISIWMGKNCMLWRFAGKSLSEKKKPWIDFTVHYLNILHSLWFYLMRIWIY